MAKVSIIIPSYNLGMHLPETLNGIWAQTYTDFETIIVDDGSTDRQTLSLLEELAKDSRLKVFSTPNQGLANTRNHAIERAVGEYILPLDSDDLILPNYLALTVPVLDQKPDVGVVSTYFRTFEARESEVCPPQYELLDLLIENVVPVTSLFRRKCWEETGGYCQAVKYEDWDFWLGILGRGYKGYVVPEFLFAYRVRHDSLYKQLSKPEIYQQTLGMLYDRHRQHYDANTREIILRRALQFSNLLAYNAELDKAKNYFAEGKEHFANEAQKWQRIAEGNSLIYLTEQGKSLSKKALRRLGLIGG